MLKITGMIFAALAVCPAPCAEVFDYSRAPLEQEPLMSTGEVMTDFPRVNDWLNANRASLTEDKFAAPRELAYLIIDSVLKGQHGEGRTTFNDFEKLVLTTLLDWASELGVYGAGLAARSFGSTTAGPKAEPLMPGAPIELRLESPNYFLWSTEATWQLQLPYYFMIFEAKRFKATNGLVTDLVIASTSFAKHEQGDGHSQASLMFMFSPKADCAVFNSYWLEKLDITAGGATEEAPFPGSKNYAAYDADQRMRTEATFVADDNGCTAFAFMGVDGTFQANRISYLDFMRSFSSTRSADSAAKEGQ